MHLGRWNRKGCTNFSSKVCTVSGPSSSHPVGGLAGWRRFNENILGVHHRVDILLYLGSGWLRAGLS